MTPEERVALIDALPEHAITKAHVENAMPDLEKVVARIAARVWDEGKSTGWSRAMRYMSDEPKVDINPPNPYRIERGENTCRYCGESGGDCSYVCS